MATGEAVASEPRLFVGQVPSEAREEDLWPLFTPFGTVRNLHLLKGGDGKPRGCAMVLFARWGQAEAAAEALDGAAALTGGQGRPLVVHFANPRRPPPGQPAEPGIAPRKLFVGQVPRDVSEDMLRPFFEPYGEIEHINILRTQRGQSAGCAFVQFRKWAEAEAAMDAHNGKTRMGSSEVPLVVKFADAKRKEAPAYQMGLPSFKADVWPPDQKRLTPTELAEFAAFQQQVGSQWPGSLLPPPNPLMGHTGLLNSQLALQQAQLQSLAGQGFGQNFAQGFLGAYGDIDPRLLEQSVQPEQQVANSREGSLESRLAENLASGSGNLVSGSGTLGTSSSDAVTEQLLQSGSLGSTMGMPLPQGLQGGPDFMTSQSMQLPTRGSASELAQQLSDLGLGGARQAQGREGSGGTPFARSDGYPAGLPDLQGNLGAQMGGAQIGGGLPSLQGGPGGQYLADMSNMYLAGLGRGMAPSSLGYGNPMGGLGREIDHSGRPWGQKIGSTDKYNEWKLFIGQVPLEATEEDLWNLFSPIGQILELYILRNNNAKSRGCAFVTYANQFLAEQAITQLNGKQVPPGKTLVVKFADRAIAGKPMTVQSNLLNMYMK